MIEPEIKEQRAFYSNRFFGIQISVPLTLVTAAALIIIAIKKNIPFMNLSDIFFGCSMQSEETTRSLTALHTRDKLNGNHSTLKYAPKMFTLQLETLRVWRKKEKDKRICFSDIVW